MSGNKNCFSQRENYVTTKCYVRILYTFERKEILPVHKLRIHIYRFVHWTLVRIFGKLSHVNELKTAFFILCFKNFLSQSLFLLHVHVSRSLSSWSWMTVMSLQNFTCHISWIIIISYCVSIKITTALALFWHV